MKKIGAMLIMMINLFAFNSIYIWSKEFAINNNAILSFIKSHNINVALISASKNIDCYKLYDFTKIANKNKIKVEFLIGDNSWIYPEKRDKILNKLKFLSQFNNFYIHLDVEPHTIKSLKKYRDKYLNMYLEMLKYIKDNFPKYKISISIPTFYNIKYVEKFSNYVDYIYLMAYEYKKLSQLQKRIDRYKSLKSKIVVAFNCKDFTKEKLINDVNFVKSLGYKNIAFHSFSSLKGLYEIK